MVWHEVKIGDLFTLEKGSLQSTKCTPGEYDFITAAEKWKTHNEYTHDCEGLIFAAAASGSLGRVHYVAGKFITSDLCFILRPKNPKKYPLSIRFYYRILNSLRPLIVKATKAGTSKESISQSRLKAYEVPYVPVDLQESYIDKIDLFSQQEEEIIIEIEKQKKLLAKYRQAILQEGIEGKLTEDWRAENPDVEPASELLKRIAAEKAELVKQKKIRKQKKLPEIKPEEIPFEIPESWEWCRLGALSDVKVGATPSRNNKKFWGGDIHWASSGEVANNYISDTKEKITPLALAKTSAELSPKGSVLVAMIGQGKTRGQTAILNIDAATNQNVATIRHIGMSPEYIWFFFLSQYEKTRSGASGGSQPALNGIKIKNTEFPLPPLAEQQEIVRRVEARFALCDQLEAQINASAHTAETLSAAILQELFDQNGGKN